MALGALATGSGAVSTTASIVNSVEPTSEMSLVVNERVEGRAGAAFNDDGSVKSAYDDQYVQYDSNQSFFDESTDTLDDIDKSEPPVATVSPRDTDVNEDVKIQVAFPLDMESDTYTFENILEIENYGGESQSIGIRYDRTDATYDPNGQYGEDATNTSPDENTLTYHDIRWVYKFVVPDRFTQTNGSTLISPNYQSSSPSPSNDDPDDYFSVDSGQTLQLDLKIDLNEYSFVNIDPRVSIESEVDKSPSFTGTTDLVNLLDAITIETDDA
jgi:hypothetical protein